MLRFLNLFESILDWVFVHRCQTSWRMFCICIGNNTILQLSLALLLKCLSFGCIYYYYYFFLISCQFLALHHHYRGKILIFVNWRFYMWHCFYRFLLTVLWIAINFILLVALNYNFYFSFCFLSQYLTQFLCLTIYFWHKRIIITYTLLLPLLLNYSATKAVEMGLKYLQVIYKMKLNWYKSTDPPYIHRKFITLCKTKQYGNCKVCGQFQIRIICKLPLNHIKTHFWVIRMYLIIWSFKWVYLL